MNRILLHLSLLSIPLLAANTGCSSAVPEVEVVSLDIGGVANSTTYSLDRSSFGTTFEILTSDKSTYKSNATLGKYLSSARTKSKHYVAGLSLVPSIVGNLTIEDEAPAAALSDDEAADEKPLED